MAAEHVVRRAPPPARRRALLLGAVAGALWALWAQWAAAPEAPAEDFVGVAARYGYRAERHTVTTEDGYVLTVFRIPRGRRCASGARGPPVLLLNGLLLDAETWLAAGPGAALGFLLPDACHDTWAGSARGGTHGRAHVRLDPRHAAFWQFSADEIGRYDVPATVDYVLSRARAARLHLVGYSQGGGAALVMLAERPRYARKVGVLVAAAPVAALRHIASPFGTLLSAAALAEGALALLGAHEQLGAGSWARRLCAARALRRGPCAALLGALDAPHAGSVARETYDELFAHFPGGASLRTLARYGQHVGAARFAKYSGGARANARRYGGARAPEYSLRAVAARVVLLQGAADALVAPADARWLARRLPRAELHVLPDARWNHLDMLLSRHTNRTLFPLLERALRRPPDAPRSQRDHFRPGPGVDAWRHPAAGAATPSAESSASARSR
ncbi:lipase 3-like [Bicyclus anynana]|uniref:Lipase 3-like n=1 Tax=Bicyclus anynana TaxID=110368 RepID=A0ABM3M6R0_BICAN|nr:lipase 3-like [Bicyclus anynana]